MTLNNSKQERPAKGHTICNIEFNAIDCRSDSWSPVYLYTKTYTGNVSAEGYSLVDTSNSPITLHDTKLVAQMQLKYLRGIKRLQKRILKEFSPQFKCNPCLDKNNKAIALSDEEDKLRDEEYSKLSQIERKEKLDDLYYT